jgi:hypothetical protein
MAAKETKRKPRNTSSFDLFDNVILIAAALAVNETDESGQDVLNTRMAVFYHLKAIQYCDNGLKYYSDFEITHQMKTDMMAYLKAKNIGNHLIFVMNCY